MPASMTFETRIAVVIREDLLNWQKLNVTAFTVGGIASLPDTIGENYVDGSGRVYLPMIRQPILIFAANREQIRTVYETAVHADAQFSIYTEELFATGNDIGAVVRAVPSEELKLVGMAIRARKKVMEKLTKGLKLHP